MGRARDERYEEDEQPRRRRRDEENDEEEAPRRRRNEEDDERGRKKKKGGKGFLITMIVGGLGLIALMVVLILVLSGGGVQSRLAGKWKTESKMGGGGPFKRTHTVTWEFQSGGKFSREILEVVEGENMNFVDGKMVKEKETRESRVTLSGEFKVGTHKMFGDMISLQPLKKETERKKNGKKEEEKEKKDDRKDEDEELRAEIYSVIIIGDTLAFQPMGMGREGTLKRVK
jgi:hypothetical protein